MAYGLPVVSFNCESGPKNIIDHNVNGLLVENGNIEALIVTLDKVITDKKLRLQLASNAIIVRDIYNIKNIANEWNNLFNSLL
jgi:glycosyltransferase involved in cell wall biosynthesis